MDEAGSGEARGEYIQVSRDRLVENRAYRALERAVRWALDYYAMQEAKRQFAEKASKPVRQPSERLAGIAEILTEYRDRVPKEVLHQIEQRVCEAASVTEEVEQATAAPTEHPGRRPPYGFALSQSTKGGLSDWLGSHHRTLA